jgi:hypothetical protein
MPNALTLLEHVDAPVMRRACGEARTWLATQPDLETAWAACERPGWMLWLAMRRGVNRKVIVRVACACARTALRFVPAGEDRPRLAIETTEAWTRGEATIEQVREARADAYDAYDAYAYDAAYAAVDAADAADADADAAAYAAYAAAAAATAAAAAAAATAANRDQARRAANTKMCDIVRDHIRLADVVGEAHHAA